MSELSFFFTEWDDSNWGGGRNPLGLQSVWSAYAREYIQGVNSVSGDLMGWRTLLVGIGIAEWLHGVSASKKTIQDTVLAFERLVAYVRMRQAEGAQDKGEILDFRGKNSIASWKNLPKIYVSSSHNNIDLLKNQRGNGIIGQISGAMEAMGIIEKTDRLALTAETRKCFWKDIQNHLEQNSKSIKSHLHDILCEGTAVDETLNTVIWDVIGTSFTSKNEQDWWEKNLILGGSVPKSEDSPKWKSEKQENLRNAILSCIKTGNGHDLFKVNTVCDTISKLQNNTHNEDLHQWLEDLKQIEIVFGQAKTTFDSILEQCGNESKSIDDLKISLESDLKKSKFSLSSLKRETDLFEHICEIINSIFPSGSNGQCSNISSLMQKMCLCSDTTEYLETLIELNVLITKKRGKQPFLEKIEQSRNTTLQWKTYSQYRSDREVKFATPPQWVHGYYLPQYYRLIKSFVLAQEKRR